jgi:hypothetical protein
VLPGYADEVYERVQDGTMGLSLGLVLRPQAVVNRERATRAASLLPVDDDARTATARFLGTAPTLGRLTFVRGASLGIPLVTLRLGGDGAAEFDWIMNDGARRSAPPVHLAPAEMDPLYAVLLAQGFATLVCAERQGMVDEVFYEITVTNATGASHACRKWGDDVNPRFDAVLAVVTAMAARVPPATRKEIDL